MQYTTVADKSDMTHSEGDRLAVVVTGYGVDKVLGTFKLHSGTRQSQAKATFELLELWKVNE